MPAAFAWPDVFALTDEPWEPALVYTPRGVGDAVGARRGLRPGRAGGPRSAAGGPRSSPRCGRRPPTSDLAARLGASAGGVLRAPGRPAPRRPRDRERDGRRRPLPPHGGRRGIAARRPSGLGSRPRCADSRRDSPSSPPLAPSRARGRRRADPAVDVACRRSPTRSPRQGAARRPGPPAGDDDRRAGRPVRQRHRAARSWAMGLDAAPDCGGANACFVASFTGERGGDAVRRHARAPARRAAAASSRRCSCGGSCAPPQIQWKMGSTLYTIQAPRRHQVDRAAHARPDGQLGDPARADAELTPALRPSSPAWAATRSAKPAKSRA